MRFRHIQPFAGMNARYRQHPIASTVLAANCLLALTACGDFNDTSSDWSESDEPGAVSATRQASTMVGQATDITTEDTSGSHNSVQINNCSAQMVNKWYAITAAHCVSEGAFNAVVRRAGPLRFVPHPVNPVEIYSGPAIGYQTDAWIAARADDSDDNNDSHAGIDLAVVQFTASGGIDTCEDKTSDCFNSERTKPINGRFSLLEHEPTMEVFHLFGWGKGYDDGTDLGRTGTQRHGLLDVRSPTYYNRPDTSFSQGLTVIPTAGAHLVADLNTSNKAWAAIACKGDSGAPWLHHAKGDFFVSYAVNKSGISNTACQTLNSVPRKASAHALVDAAPADLIYELEAKQGNGNRFSCWESSNTDSANRPLRYWWCDNGTELSGWHSNFYLRYIARGGA